MKTVRSSAPGKLMLFGEHAVVYGYPCIASAVNQRLYVTVKSNPQNDFILTAPDLGIQEYRKNWSEVGHGEIPKAVSFIEKALQFFLEQYPQREEIFVETHSDFSASFGFGSSSASAVAFLHALSTFYNVTLSQDELFDLAYKTVLAVQGVGSGFDVAAAVYGKTFYYVAPKFGQPSSKIIKPILVPVMPFLVAYTGVKADTTTLVRMVSQMYQDNPEKLKKIFQKIAVIVEQAGEALEKNDSHLLAQLVNENQILLRNLQVSSDEIELILNLAKRNSALAGKLSGAGGGDCVLLLVEREHVEDFKKALKDSSAEILDVQLGAPGVRLEFDESGNI